MLHGYKAILDTGKRLISLSLITGVMSFSALATTAPKAPTTPMPTFERAIDDRFLSSYETGRKAEAEKFIRLAGISKNLSLLLLQDVKNAQAVNAAIDRLGMDKVQASVVRAIRSAQKSHEGEWVQVLAGIYSQHFTGTQLRSIMTERELSPHFPRLVEMQDVIADAVQEQGRVIFTQALTDVMGELNARFSR